MLMSERVRQPAEQGCSEVLSRACLASTSGGILVLLLILVLGRDQHSAQDYPCWYRCFREPALGVRQYARQRP